MICKIAKKEFLLNLITFKFTVGTILCIILVSFFVPTLPVDLASVVIPDMHYRYANMAEIFKAGLVDVVLLISFTFLFFSLAFAMLNRYDVRP